MGKYMKKSKIAGDVAVMDVSQPTSFGVRTRAAKNLALQRLRSFSPSPAAATVVDTDSSRYLQLRSRRLEKPLLLTETRKPQPQQQLRQRVCDGEARNSRAKSGPAKSESPAPAPIPERCESKGYCGNIEETTGSDGNFFEASFGENSFDFETRDRSTRESTPCNLITDSEAIKTPGSTTKRTSPARTCERSRDSSRGTVPSSREIEEFFEYAEQQQQRFFIEKYNFDIVEDSPLPGRYEWVRVVP